MIAMSILFAKKSYICSYFFHFRCFPKPFRQKMKELSLLSLKLLSVFRRFPCPPSYFFAHARDRSAFRQHCRNVFLLYYIVESAKHPQNVLAVKSRQSNAFLPIARPKQISLPRGCAQAKKCKKITETTGLLYINRI